MLEDYIVVWANKHPDKLAVIDKDQTLTYSQLLQQVEARKRQLAVAGLREGMAMPLTATTGADFLISYFAAHLLGAAVAPLAPQTSNIKLQTSNFKLQISDLLFTTGTTGKSKGVMLSHEAILADADNLVHAHGYTPDLTFILTGPLNHLGSLSKIWPTLMVGATLHIVESIKDPNPFFQAIDRAPGKVATFLVPANIKMLITFSKKQLEQRAAKIDFLETGAAPISEADIHELCRILPATRLFNTYASTETGIVCTFNFNYHPSPSKDQSSNLKSQISNLKSLQGCVGKPMKNSSVFITPDGTVACKGKTLMTGYYNDDDLTAQVLRDGVVYTHDQGYIDEHECLHLTGRTDDIINVGGYKVNPIEVENTALTCPFVADCICVPAPHPVLGTTLHLIVVTRDNEPLDKRALATFLASKLDHYKLPQRFSQTDKLKRTFNGKLDRKAYQSK